MLRQFELIERLKSYDPSANEELVKKAYVFAIKAHGDQRRASGAPYFSHPIEVAEILTELKLDTQSIVTALLHDTIEDTLATVEEIEALFGPEVAKLVQGVTKLSTLELQSEATKQAENFRKLVVAMSSDIRVLLVKLADRLHNMRTLYFIKDPKKRKRIAKETLDIYAPLAERMGIQKIKDELEDLAFCELQSEVYDSITSRLKFLHDSSGSFIEKIIKDLTDSLIKEKISTFISGRLKTPYSIWQKMQRKNVGFEQLSDIMAFRIIVKSIPDCYKVLGIIHSTYLVVPGRFKDYISTPKSNHYQSLHTGVIGPLNYRIEIQIRTQKMHETAEFGIAAHWEYKNNTSTHDGRQYAWLRSLLEILEHVPDPEEFMEHTKLEIFQDQVFCFTPKGELVSLPKGATVLDFSYAIHSEIGDHTIGGRVNGKQVPLRHVLQNGDQVEIITSKTQTPSVAWERFVVTGKARVRIRRFIKNQYRKDFITIGQTLLQKYCERKKIDYNEKNLLSLLSSYGFKTLDDLFASIGEKIYNPQNIADKLIKVARKEKAGETPDSTNLFSERKKIELTPTIKGLSDGIVYRFSGCCNPIPGDPILGIVTTGKRISIHQKNCKKVADKNLEERILDLNWNKKIPEETLYTTRLRVICMNTKGILANLTSVISQQRANIVNLKTLNHSKEFWDLLIYLEVENTHHVNNIMASLRGLESISSAERYF